MNDKIVLGTRGSELALAQSRLVEDALRAKWSGLELSTKIIKTGGDERRGPPDALAGRKGLFTAEIERGLLARQIDVAVHSAKDLPSTLTDGTDIAAALPRAPFDDLLVSLGGYDLQSLPLDGIVATGSVRRRHQLRWKRPDVEVVDLRGNVPTRLRKLSKDEWHGAILARAGLERLGFKTNGEPLQFENAEFFTTVLPHEVFLPAGGQGIIAVQIRENDDRVRMLVEPLNHLDTRLCLRAEREFLRLLQGDCNQPVGVLANINGNTMTIRGQVFQLEANTPNEAAVEGHFEEAERLAAKLLERINAR
jgi:hydroxymethylbilane synthase